MARENNASNKNKRSFAFNPDNMLRARPTIPDGVYAGVLVNPAIYSKEGKPFILIEQAQSWNDSEKKYEKVENEWVINGKILYQAKLLSERAKNLLQKDEPMVIGGNIKLNFHKVGTTDNDGNDISFTLDLNNNIALRNTLDNLGIDLNNFVTNVDFEYYEDLEIPAGLENVPDIINMLNAVNYAKALFNEVVKAMNGSKAGINVARVQNKRSNEMENQISCGSNGSACGIIKYVDGMEFDLK